MTRALLVVVCFCVFAAPPEAREPILSAMQEVMGPLPRAKSGGPEVRIIEEVKLPGYIRRKILFGVDADEGRARPVMPLY